MWQCYYCRNPLSAEVQQKNRLCPSCGSDIHCCRNCVHHDESLSTRCREPESPWIRDTAASNTCPYFEFQGAPQQTRTEDPAQIEAERAKEAFRALFRDT